MASDSALRTRRSVYPRRTARRGSLNGSFQSGDAADDRVDATQSHRTIRPSWSCPAALHHVNVAPADEAQREVGHSGSSLCQKDRRLTNDLCRQVLGDGGHLQNISEWRQPGVLFVRAATSAAVRHLLLPNYGLVPADIDLSVSSEVRSRRVILEVQHSLPSRVIAIVPRPEHHL